MQLFNMSRKRTVHRPLWRTSKKFRFFMSAAAFCLPASFALAFGAGFDKPRHMRELDNQRDPIREVIETEDWAREAFEVMKERVDGYATRVGEEPDWAVSRLAMYWDNHWTTPIIRESKTVGGEGRAPVPTPRFAGKKYPADGRVRLFWEGYGDGDDPIAAMRPYNDKDGKVWMYDHSGIGMGNTDAPHNWVEQWRACRILQGHNYRLLHLAAQAGFVYWLTGEEKYAEFAAPILWTYMHGMSYRELARIEGPSGEDDTSHDYIAKTMSLTTYQTLGEPARPIAWAYDFLYDYIKNNDLIDSRSIEINGGEKMDAAVIDRAIKKIADVQIQQGGPRGNWNTNQAGKIALLALRLKDDDAYADGKGRSYYMNVVLNAGEMRSDERSESSRHGNWRQGGLMEAVESDMCSETGLWKEHGGYGFGPPGGVLSIAELMPNENPDEAGYKLFNHPSMRKVIFSQYYQSYPDGLAPAIGISGRARPRYGIAEKMLAWALKTGQDELADRLSALLHSAIEAGYYQRTTEADKSVDTGNRRFVGNFIDALTREEPPELPEPDVRLRRPATFYAPALNIVRLTSLPPDKSSDRALAAAIYGSKGGQHHAHGLAIDLFGAGHNLGVDPGIDQGRHSDQHWEYFAGTPAHNTVIVKGRSNQRNLPMRIRTVQPPIGENSASEQEASKADFVYAQGELNYDEPTASQQRTLALVRIDGETAFFFDVFRSRRDEPDSEEYHDYLYQNRSDRMEITDAAGEPLPFERSRMLTSDKGNLVGYDYFKNEQSVFHDGHIRVQWPWRTEAGGEVVMDLLMPEGEDRQVFRVDAPNTRGFSGPLRKLLVRQRGEAWERPFVAVYAPRPAGQPPMVQSVETVGKDSWRIHGEDWSAELTLEGSRLQGEYKKAVQN